jgi:hypothetical protein
MDAITLSRVSANPVLPVLPLLPVLPILPVFPSSRLPVFPSSRLPVFPSRVVSCMRMSQTLGEGRNRGLNEAWYGRVCRGIRKDVVVGQTRPFPGWISIIGECLLNLIVVMACRGLGSMNVI